MLVSISDKIWRFWTQPVHNVTRRSYAAITVGCVEHTGMAYNTKKKKKKRAQSMLQIILTFIKHITGWSISSIMIFNI